MGKFAYLVMVSESNNNKFYEMKELDDGTIELHNGRVDVTRIRQSPKPIGNWEKIYNSKIKKGYRDVTSLVSKKIIKENKVEYVDVDNKEVKDVINKLIAFSKQTVDNNYRVKSSSVTRKQIDEAQSTLDGAIKLIRKNASVEDINEKLLYLFSVIPRKMKRVQDYLIDGITLKTKNDLEYANKILSNEQDVLDALSSNVFVCSDDEDEEDKETVEQKTILDKLGIEMEPASDEDVKNIKRHLGEISDKFIRAFVVTHKESRIKFEKHVKNAKNKKKKLFWHGSRNENWQNILRTSLLIRPAGVITQGAMFGSSCIYFANRARKSYGYTSSRGSYWCKGSSNVAYMAVFDVHVGEQWEIERHESYCYTLDEKKVKAKGCDSVFAKKGVSLYNDEFMVYNSNQCTIKYLVELEG